LCLATGAGALLRQTVGGSPPAKPAAPSSAEAQGFVGREICAECHPAQGGFGNAMSRASEKSPDFTLLREHPELEFHAAPFTIRIATDAGGASYSVTDGRSTVSEKILWAFGQGGAGQTYIFRHNGTYYQSRVSYFKAASGLDYTIGYKVPALTSLDQALGVPMSADETFRCFNCHTSDSTVGMKVDEAAALPAVQCEHCHGPGALHIAAMQRGDLKTPQIRRLTNLTAEDQVNFCGTCHRTAQDIINSDITGILTIRMQPYRLTTSECYDPGDRRIGCLACHDPHQAVDRDLSHYDVKCLACHPKTRNQTATAAAADVAPRACPVATSNCVSCHMPRLALPGGHVYFTDHRIRIVHPGEPFPG
jgi:hypothetical protein